MQLHIDILTLTKERTVAGKDDPERKALVENLRRYNIAANLKPFKDLTGIDVEISQLELGSLVQKVSLDVSSGDPTIHVIYADPYQVMAPFAAASRSP